MATTDANANNISPELIDLHEQYKRTQALRGNDHPVTQYLATLASNQAKADAAAAQQDTLEGSSSV
jgi:hypothetical protein